jgi:arylsulfatase A-like enzyme
MSASKAPLANANWIVPVTIFGIILPLDRALADERNRDSNKPNILIIVGDDMGYADVGFHGAKDIPTPHLDSLAASGVQFTSGYVSGPYCSPTRAGLLTGRYQQRFGHEFNPGSGPDAKSTEPSGLPLDETTLANRLHDAGYRTSLVGKWHLGGKPEQHPLQRGFDEFYGFFGGQHSYFDPKGVYRGTTPVDSLDYTTDAFGREAIAFIEKNQDRPWFLYLAFNSVHTPMESPQKYLDRFAHVEDKTRREYSAMMSAMDDAIGSVLDKLRASNQLENTLIAFISDNGGPTMKSTTINASQNHPLRGGKRTTLEGGIRVPFLISWKSKITPATVEHPVIQLDLHTTALSAAGIPLDPKWKLDGVNLLPLLQGISSEAPHDALYWKLGKQFAIREGDWKLVAYDTNADTNTGERQPVSGSRLYNLAADIHEDADLSSQHPEKVQQLRSKWQAWDRLNIAPLWGGDRTH